MPFVVGLFIVPVAWGAKILARDRYTAKFQNPILVDFQDRAF